MRFLFWLAPLAAVLVALGLYLRSFGYYPDDDLLGK